MRLSSRVLVERLNLVVRDHLLHGVPRQFLNHVALDLVATHLYASLLVLLLNPAHQPHKLHAPIASSFARRHVRQGLHVLESEFVLIQNATQSEADTSWGLAEQSHLEEVGRVFLLDPDSASGRSALDNAVLAATFNVELFALKLAIGNCGLHEEPVLGVALVQAVLACCFER